MKKLFIAASAGVMALGFASVATAAGIGSMGALESARAGAERSAGLTEDVARRRICTWRRGIRRCRWVWVPRHRHHRKPGLTIRIR